MARNSRNAIGLDADDGGLRRVRDRHVGEEDARVAADGQRHARLQQDGRRHHVVVRRRQRAVEINCRRFLKRNRTENLDRRVLACTPGRRERIVKRAVDAFADTRRRRHPPQVAPADRRNLQGIGRMPDERQARVQLLRRQGRVIAAEGRIRLGRRQAVHEDLLRQVAAHAEPALVGRLDAQVRDARPHREPPPHADIHRGARTVRSAERHVLERHAAHEHRHAVRNRHGRSGRRPRVSRQRATGRSRTRRLHLDRRRQNDALLLRHGAHRLLERGVRVVLNARAGGRIVNVDGFLDRILVGHEETARQFRHRRLRNRNAGMRPVEPQPRRHAALVFNHRLAAKRHQHGDGVAIRHVAPRHEEHERALPKSRVFIDADKRMLVSVVQGLVTNLDIDILPVLIAKQRFAPPRQVADLLRLGIGGPAVPVAFTRAQLKPMAGRLGQQHVRTSPDNVPQNPAVGHQGVREVGDISRVISAWRLCHASVDRDERMTPFRLQGGRHLGQRRRPVGGRRAIIEPEPGREAETRIRQDKANRPGLAGGRV